MEERKKILELLETGKISADEATRLLEALEKRTHRCGCCRRCCCSCCCCRC